MVAPYRVPFFKELAADPRVILLRVLTCVEREIDRQWQVETSADYIVKVLPGITLNLKKNNDALRILHFRFGIFWELLLYRPDTLVIGDASWTSFIAVLACKMFGIPYVVWNEITTTSKVSKGMVARLRRWMFRGADQLIASCGMARDFLIQNDVKSEKIHIVLNAVDNDYFLEQRIKWEPKRTELRAELNIAEDAFCFIYVGQLISRKRVIETVELLSKVAQKTSIHLLVVGSGPLENSMRYTAEINGLDAITFCGFAETERLSQLYVASDSLILLSEDEHWGIVINEVILFGKGYITTDSVAAGYELARNITHKSVEFSAIDTAFISRYIDLNENINPVNELSFCSPRTMADGFYEVIQCN